MIVDGFRFAPVEPVRIIIDAASVEAEETVESARVGHGGGRRAQMPFAHHARDITGILKAGGDGFFRFGQSGAISGHTSADGVSAGKKRGSRRSADRSRSVPVGEACAGAREGVNVGSLEIGGSEAAQIVTALIVGKEYDEVGTAYGGLGKSGLQDGGAGGGEEITTGEHDRTMIAMAKHMGDRFKRDEMDDCAVASC